MQLSDNTQKILSNFSNINASIVIRPGNVITTISPAKNIFAVAKVEEVFPVEFAVYSVAELLKVISLFDAPDINFTDQAATLKQDNRQLEYVWSSLNIVEPAPSEDKIPDFDFTFSVMITASDLKNVLDVSATMKLDLLKFESDGEKLSLIGTKAKNPDSNSYELEMMACPLGKPFSIHITSENLKLIPGDYNCQFNISDAPNAIVFQNTASELKYIIAVDGTSILP